MVVVGTVAEAHHQLLDSPPEEALVCGVVANQGPKFVERHAFGVDGFLELRRWRLLAFPLGSLGCSQRISQRLTVPYVKLVER